MTKPKHVPSTLMTILNAPVIQAIRNRSEDIVDICSVVDGFWKYDLLNRKPSPAEYDDEGNLIKSTNLDLATFLYALMDRGAVINLPIYESSTPTSLKEGQHVLSKENRHGKIIGVVSNQETFNFSVKIIDQNIIGTDSTGFPRNFNLTDFNGNWYDGWKKINFIPSTDENKFLTENKLWGNNTVTFNNFVTPEKWISMFGQYYFITKCTIDRLKEEISYLRKVKRDLLNKGIQYPSGCSDFQEVDKWNSKTINKEKGYGVKIKSLEVKVDIPEFEGEYQEYDETSEALRNVSRKLKNSRKYLEKFKFATRCIEFAMHKGQHFESFPVWFKNVKWEDYKETPKARTIWKRLKLVQPGVGQLSVSLRYRYFEKTQYVNKKVAEKFSY